MSVDKRKRSINFSADEKMRFLRILQRKGKVIISKVTSHDLQTNRLKEEAWTEIRNDLNASGNVIRTTDNLKKLWQKMKTEAKTFKSIAYNQTYGTGGGPSKKMDDPVLELVAQITGRASSGIELANDCDSILDTNIQSPVTPSKPSHSGLDFEKPQSPLPTPPIIVMECSPSIEFEAVDTEVCIEDTVENVTPKSVSNLKRRWPVLDSINERSKLKSKRVSLNNSFASERLKAEQDKRCLIQLQQQHLIEQHTIKIEHANLKTKILKAVLQEIQDERPVDPELLKIVSNF